MEQTGQRLAGKVAVVTGAGNGIGRATALLLARQGAKVVGGEIVQEAMEETAERAAAEGLQVDVGAPADLRVEADAQRLIDETVERHGGLDVVVNAAGHSRFETMEKIDYEEHWRYTLDAELDTTFLVTKAAWPHLKKNGGSIVNFTSVIAWQAVKHFHMVAHAAGKGGVLSMTRELAKEGGPHGIRANSISPGFIAVEGKEWAAQHEEWGPYARERAMLGRHGKAEEIAWGVLFLASDESSFVTGTDLHIDGGWTAW